MPSLLAFAFFAGLFFLATKGLPGSRAPRVFTMQAGRRYRVQANVSPPVPVSAREAFRTTLTALGATDVTLTSSGEVSSVAYTTATQPVTLTVTEGQNLDVLGGHRVVLENVREL